MTKRDLSLVEVGIAISLLLILLAGLFATLGASQRAHSETRAREAASRALFSALNDLEVVPFDELQVGTNLPAYAFPVLHATDDRSLTQLLPASSDVHPRNVNLPSTPADEAAYAGHVSVIRDPSGDGSDDLLALRLTVAWRGVDGRDQVLSICSRRSRP